MGAFGLLLMLALSCFWGSVKGNYFFVVAPNMIRFEHPETVMVSVFGNQKTVSVWFSHGDRRFSEHNNLIVSEDTPHQVEMVVRETDLALEDGETKPRTILLNALCDGDHKQKEILLQYSSGYIFVQTSQPIYVPRSTVKIRYLAVDESMKKLSNKVNVSMDIISPDNQVFSRKHKTNSDAFYTYDFELPPNPEMGIWTIKVYFKGMYETEEKAFFEVREYVVPTFGVDIDVTPNTILENTPGTVTVTVTSKYVYGKPVIGSTDIKLSLTENTGDTELLAMPRLSLNADGQAEFKIPVRSLRRPLEDVNKWFPDDQRLKVVATVTEGATLQKEVGIHEGVVFSRVQYKFKFDRSKKYFRPLRKFYLKLDVTFPNGHAAASVDVIATQRIAGRTVERDGQTDDNGQITFIFDCEGDTMTFSANDADGMSPSDNFIVEAYRGPNQILAEHIIKDGEHQIRSFNNIQEDSATGLTSMIVARGKILDATWERQSNEPVKILTDDLQERVSPSGRFIIFYCDTGTNEVVADAIKFTMTPRCKGQGIHLNTEQRVTPGDSKDMKVTGQPGTHVGLSAVDKAVLLLNNKNVLHKNKGLKNEFETAMVNEPSVFDPMKFYCRKIGARHSV